MRQDARFVTDVVGAVRWVTLLLLTAGLAWAQPVPDKEAAQEEPQNRPACGDRKAYPNDVQSLVVSPDGTMFATGGVKKHLFPGVASGNGLLGALLGSITLGGQDYRIKIWSMSDGRPLNRLDGQSSGTWALRFSPDGKTVVSGGADGIKLSSLSDGGLVKTITDRPKEIVLDVDVSPDGKTLVSGSTEDRSIKLWSLPDGNRIATLRWQSFLALGIRFVRISPDGKLLAASNLNDFSVKVWSLPEGKLLETLSMSNSRIADFRFSPDGKLLAAVDQAGTVKLWSLSDGKPFKTLKGSRHFASITLAIEFTPDGRYLVGGGGAWIYYWSIPDGEMLGRIHTGTDVFGIALDGKRLVAAKGERVSIWSFPEGQFLGCAFDPEVHPAAAKKD